MYHKIQTLNTDFPITALEVVFDGTYKKRKLLDVQKNARIVFKLEKTSWMEDGSNKNW